MKTKVIRHGEICFCPIKALPKGLKEAKTNVIVQGSHGNSHTFDKGKIYFKAVDQWVFGYFVAKDTTLLHAEHGVDGKAELPDGVYELRKQSEYTPNGLIPVVD